MSMIPMISNRGHGKEQHRTLFQGMVLVRNVLIQIIHSDLEKFRLAIHQLTC